MGASLPAGSLRVCAAPDQVADSPHRGEAVLADRRGPTAHKVVKAVKVY